MKYPLFLTVVTVLLSASACDRAETGTPVAPTTERPADALPANLLMTNPPAGAKPVSEVRGSAKPGEQVTVRGVVGGRADPIAENRAIITLLDPSVRTCDKVEGDACSSPWDACCEPTDVIAANSATVQVTDAAGNPLKTGLTGVGGLAPLKTVVVTGIYRPSPDGKAAVVDAEGLYVEP